MSSSSSNGTSGSIPKKILDPMNVGRLTRENVASHLQPFRDQDSWAFFRRKAFWHDPDHSSPKELRPLAEAILKKCEGLPLAIVTLGGLMCSRSKRAAEWNFVATVNRLFLPSIESSFSQTKTDGFVFGILV